MGVKFNREYEHIIHDLTEALGSIPECHEFFEMEEKQWSKLSGEERRECLRTLADDVFYGLGAESFIEVGESMVTYHREDHTLRVSIPDKPLQIIPLI